MTGALRGRPGLEQRVVPSPGPSGQAAGRGAYEEAPTDAGL